MTIDKAIQTLERIFRVRSNSSDVEVFDAVRLGIEALKLYMALKATGGVPKRFSGIGETQE